MQTQSNATNYTIPAAGQSAADWCESNGLFPYKRWSDVCRSVFNTECPKTESARRMVIRLLGQSGSQTGEKSEVIPTASQTPAKEVKEKPKAAPKPKPDPDGNSLAATIAAAIAEYQTAPAMDEGRVIELIKQHGGGYCKEIQVNELPPVQVDGLIHKQLQTLITIVKSGCNVWLDGSAGSGKTTAAEQVAKALNLPFYAASVCGQTTKSDLFGYMNATGEYVGTVLRQAFEFGGVFLLDEVDAGNANVLAALNSTLANGYCSFPDGMIKRHKDFFVIAAGNTVGEGANRVYVGRNVIDGATRDRFVFLNWEIDEELELKLSGNPDWCKKVQAVRKALNGERIIISPRATMQGAKLLAAGIPEAEVVRMVLLRGNTNENIQTKVNNAIKSL